MIFGIWFVKTFLVFMCISLWRCSEQNTSSCLLALDYIGNRSFRDIIEGSGFPLLEYWVTSKSSSINGRYNWTENSMSKLTLKTINQSQLSNFNREDKMVGYEWRTMASTFWMPAWDSRTLFSDPLLRLIIRHIWEYMLSLSKGFIPFMRTCSYTAESRTVP